jgi:hypothetical protein
MYAKEMVPKCYVATVRGRFADFMVFETLNSKFYLFSAVVNGIETGVRFPVRKSDLRDDVAEALRNGYGNA